MELVKFAERELREAGLFDADSDYGEELGRDVLKLVEVFAEQGHSGSSANIAIQLFCKIASYRPLVPLRNPILTGEYIDRSEEYGGKPVLQSTRVSSVFSDDGGGRWHDIYKTIPRWKQLLGFRRAYIKFPKEATNG